MLAVDKIDDQTDAECGGEGVHDVSRGTAQAHDESASGTPNEGSLYAENSDWPNWNGECESNDDSV